MNITDLWKTHKNSHIETFNFKNGAMEGNWYDFALNNKKTVKIGLFVSTQHLILITLLTIS